VKEPNFQVSVAGCLGYDVLAYQPCMIEETLCVSVAGCLGYDVLGVRLRGIV
jgi:uncharacterized OsmC-like protein